VFTECVSLIGAYFRGNAPSYDHEPFAASPKVTIYYLRGTTGWSSTYAHRPTAEWTPKLESSAPKMSNGFGFALAGPAGADVVVEASTSLAHPDWLPVGTNSLTDGTSSFSDPQRTNYPVRFYRLRII
jgi:hypothetical protein